MLQYNHDYQEVKMILAYQYPNFWQYLLNLGFGVGDWEQLPES
jgi:hypothetical protein